MAAQPVFKQPVEWAYAYLPPPTGDADRHGMPPNDNEIGVGKYCLQKPRLENVRWSLFHADALAAIPMRMPTRPEPRRVLGRQQIRGLGQVRARIESEPASPTMVTIDRENILKKLPLVLEYTCILEPSAVFQSCDVAPEHTRSAALEAADEDVFAIILIVISHNDSF